MPRPPKREKNKNFVIGSGLGFGPNSPTGITSCQLDLQDIAEHGAQQTFVDTSGRVPGMQDSLGYSLHSLWDHIGFNPKP